MSEKTRLWRKGEWLSELSKMSAEGARFSVPQFFVIGAESYDEWRKGSTERLRQTISEAFRKASGFKRVIVRSSAEKAEDGENATGAGIYDSIVLHEGFTPIEFAEAMNRVYHSAGSESAVAYRKAKGIAGESMALVIQEYVRCNVRGHADSEHPNRPELVSVVANEGLAIVSRATGKLHFPYDEYKSRVTDEKTFFRVAEAALYVEKKIGRPVQVEYGFSGDRLYLFQARPLPKTEPHRVEFPKEKPLLEARSVGLANGKYKVSVIDSVHLVGRFGETESPDRGIVVFQTGNAASMNPNVSLAFPQKWAVVVLGRYSDSHGHIETLCAEKGIACLSEDMDSGKAETFCRKLADYGKARVVSDGLFGRIYSPISDEPAVFKWVLDWIENRNDDCSFVDLSYEAFTDAYDDEMGERAGESLHYVLETMVRKGLLKKRKVGPDGDADGYYAV